MKVFSKTKLIDKKQIKSIIKERKLMSKLSHPFLVNMHFSFQDNHHLFMILDLMKGGDLRYYYKLQNQKFSEIECKFMISNLILGLEYIHANYIIHCDIKPENIVISEDGYFYLSDFGIARDLKEEEKNKNSIEGSLGYMAPEIIFQKNVTLAVDYFCLGVVAYEMMMGSLPYFGKNLEDIKKLILATQVKIRKFSIPEGWSVNSADFINKLIQRKYIKRLGNNNIDEIKNHPWLSDIDWKKLYLHQLISPFQPDTDRTMFNNSFITKRKEIEDSQVTLERYKDIEINRNYSSIFDEFYYLNKFSMKYRKEGEYFINPHLKYINNSININNENINVNMKKKNSDEKGNNKSIICNIKVKY